MCGSGGMIACKSRTGCVGFGTRDTQLGALRRQAPRLSANARTRGIRCAAVKRSFKNFDDMLVNSPGPILVDFYATWCGPCVLMADVLEEVAPQIKSSMTVVKINTEKYQNLAAKYKIQELPTLIVFKNGQVAQRITGLHTAPQLMQVLAPHMAAPV